MLQNSYTAKDLEITASSDCIESEILEWAQDELEVTEFSSDGVLIAIQGEFFIQDSIASITQPVFRPLFVRRGSYAVSAVEGCRLLWLPLTQSFLQEFVQKYGELLSQVERIEDEGQSLLSFDGEGLMQESIKSLLVLKSNCHPDIIFRLRVEELLIFLSFSPQGPALMGMLRRQGGRQASRLLAFMEEHYLKEWKLSEFAKEFGMGLTTFKELFGNVYGVSPRAWIGERRILYAHQLLLNSDMSIIDIAVETGFSSQSYFTQSYRRRFGCTPSKSRTAKE